MATKCWLGSRLYDERGVSLAAVNDGQLQVGGGADAEDHVLLLRRGDRFGRFRLEAFWQGECFATIEQAGVSVSQLEAMTTLGNAQDHFNLARISPWKKDRRILNQGGELVATTRPRRDGSHFIEDGPAAVSTDPRLYALLTWAVVIVDTGFREFRI